MAYISTASCNSKQQTRYTNWPCQSRSASLLAMVRLKQGTTETGGSPRYFTATQEIFQQSLVNITWAQGCSYNVCRVEMVDIMLGGEVEVLAIMAVVGWMYWCIAYRGNRLENWIYSMGLSVWPLSTVPCLLISKARNNRFFGNLILQTVWHLKRQLINWGVGGYSANCWYSLAYLYCIWLYILFFLPLLYFAPSIAHHGLVFLCDTLHMGAFFVLCFGHKKSYSSINWKNEGFTRVGSAHYKDTFKWLMKASFYSTVWHQCQWEFLRKRLQWDYIPWVFK